MGGEMLLKYVYLPVMIICQTIDVTIQVSE